MAADTDILKTLERIETVLKKASNIWANSGNNPKREHPLDKAHRQRDPKKEEKIYKATLYRQETLNKSSMALNTSFIALKKTVDRNAAGLAKMEVVVNRVLKNLNGTLANQRPPVVNPPAPAPQQAPQTAPQAPVAPVPVVVPAAAPTIAPPAPVTPAQAPAAPPPQLPVTNRFLMPFMAGLSSGTQVVSRFTKTVWKSDDVMNALGRTVKTVAADYFELARLGAASMSSVGGLYVDAFKSGMSFKEYLEMMNSSMALLARSKSFDDFNNTISQSKDQLAELGIFGEEAAKFSASLANTSILMGVAKKDIPNAISEQVKAYKELRDQTLISAQEFARMTDRMAESETVQSALNGLAPAQRQARFAELMSLAAHNKALNISAAAAEKLTDAMIAQKGMSFKDRFEGMNQLRQMGAVLGMQQNAERAAQLYVMGQGKRGKEGDIELQGLLQGMQAKLDAFNQTGVVQYEFMYDQMKELANSTGLGNLMQATTAANLAAPIDPMKQHNEDFGQHVGVMGKAAATFFQAVTAFNKSFVGQSGLVGAIFGFGLSKVLGNVFSGTGGSTLIGSITSGLGTAMKMFGGMSIASVLINGVMEAFTGNVGAAFQEGKLAGILDAALTGMYSWFTGAIDMLFGTHITNSFDNLYVSIRLMSDEMVLWFQKKLNGWFGTSFGADNQKDIQQLKTLKESLADGTSTISSIGEKMQENQKKAVKATAENNKAMVDDTTKATKAISENTSKAFNAIATQSDITQQGLVTTARTLVNQEPVKANAISSPEKMKEEEQATQEQTKTTSKNEVNTSQDTDLLASIGKTLLDILTVNQGQLDAMKYSRPTTIADNTGLAFNKVLGI